MSRCFPFPPPGYEKTSKHDHVDILAKEKHKEKKHKKEKREKEKREGKEKKEKDRSKDKHKEKKDRKEKHRDKKKDKDKDKDKDRDKDRSRTPSEKSQKLIQAYHNDKLGENNRNDSEVKDSSKFTDELGQRIRDEEKGAAERMVINNNFTSSTQRGFEISGVAFNSEKEGISGNKMVPNSMGPTLQRRNDGLGQKVNNVIVSVQRRPEKPVSETAFQKGVAENKMVPSSIGTTQRRNDDMGQKISNVSLPVQRVQMEGVPNEKLLQDPGSAGQRGNGGQADNWKTRRALYRENQRLLQKNTQRKIEEKEKSKEKEPNDAKRQKDKSRDREEKKKKKDKEKHKDKEKEKEKKRVKAEHKHKIHDEPREILSKSLLDNLSTTKPLTVQKDGKDNTIVGIDEGIKKRKNIEMNGFLHEYDMPPTKFPRMENGRTLAPARMAGPVSSVKPVPINSIKEEKPLEVKGQTTNGIAEAHPSSADLRLLAPPSASAPNSENGEISKKPPHPDLKFLDKVYSVPKLEEWPEYDDQEWLFSGSHLHLKPGTKREADETPTEVWAEAMRIEPEDVIALPYVIPF
uniref:Myb-like protein X n=1 Tax=Ananas comosus var. bracteatus TaxID=296719 RepID=A0A6V7Q7N6_ANACO|nr:unnamed protein product [Ananas comosus var. bracteatus]